MNATENPHLLNLKKWVNDINRLLSSGFPPTISQSDVLSVRQAMSSVAMSIKEEHPFYATELPQLAAILFNTSPFAPAGLNTAAFGELFLIVKHLSVEPENAGFWKHIHPRIAAISKNLYCDGHYSAAAEKAIKEIETRLRELHRDLKPNEPVPANTSNIVGILLSETGVYQFCDTSDASGRDFRRGIHRLVEGTVAAYRNPSAHANIPYTEREAFEQIALASQLMYVLDGKSSVH